MAKLRRRYRSQTLIAQVLLALGIWMGLPFPKPVLWVLEIWGDLQLPTVLWAALFAGAGVALLLVRRAQYAMHLMMLSFVLLATVGGAAYLAQGMNGLTIVAGVLMLHSAWTAIDLKTISQGTA